MPRKYINKITPKRKKVEKCKVLKTMGKRALHAKIWGTSRRPVLGAFIIGLFVAMLPIPFQMVIVAFLAILFQANLPISISLVWISNPFTIPFFYYGQYMIGNYILEKEISNGFELTLEWFTLNLDDIYLSILIGSIIMGGLLSLIIPTILSIWWKKKVKQKRDNSIKNRALKSSFVLESSS